MTHDTIDFAPVARRTLLGATTASLVLAALTPTRHVRAADESEIVPPSQTRPWLVNANWLQAHHADDGVKVIALTSQDRFTDGHIPGALQIDWPALELAETTDDAVAAWRESAAAKLTELGLTALDRIVVYDDGSLFAARLWWVLDFFGHAQKHVLDGGLPAWRAAGGKTETGRVAPRAAETPYLASLNPSALATLEQVRRSLGNADVALVDARSPEEYAAGHIPGAVNVNYPQNAASGVPHFWKPADELRARYEKAGATPDREIIVYCSSGTRSAVTYFTLRLIGYSRVRLYSASWDEWKRHSDLPVAKGDQA